MNICFFISDASCKGGTERISFQVATVLLDAGHQVCFISWHEKQVTTFFPLDRRIQRFNLQQDNSSQNVFSKLLLLRKLLSKNNADLIIDVDTVLTPYTMLAKTGLKIKHIAWEHFNASINLGVKRRDWGRRLAARFADISVVLTDEDKAQWQKRFTVKHRLLRIYNPVTVPVRNSIIPVGSSNVFLAVGRLTKQKGFDRLLTAWALIPEAKRSGALLRIIGEGEDKQSLIQQASALNIAQQVDFFGTTNNIQAEYARSYAYVLSSRFEGFVLTLTEAMASGLPVISFDCPCGPSELLIDDAGMLVTDGDISALSEAMELLLDQPDKRDAMATKCLQRSRDFTHNTIMPQWLHLIDSLS